jgi:hypothetical protein
MRPDAQAPHFENLQSQIGVDVNQYQMILGEPGASASIREPTQAGGLTKQ